MNVIRNSPYFQQAQYGQYGQQFGQANGFGMQSPLEQLRAMLGPGGPTPNSVQGDALQQLTSFFAGLLSELMGPQLGGMGDQSSFSLGGPQSGLFNNGSQLGSGLSFGGSGYGGGGGAGGYGGAQAAAGGYGGAGGVGGPGYGGGGYGGGGVGMPPPSDRNEFASYIAAATNRNGEQNGNINQSRAIAGTRFGQVQDGQQFDAAVARNYAYQFAAQANGMNPRDPQGLAQGAQAFYNMSADAQTFMQVASVYKGDLAGGAKNYDNGKLQQLLQQSGYPGANGPGVGDTDVETIGAVADAINRGYVSLQDITNTPGAVKNPGAYQQAIDFVQNGELANLLNQYEGGAPGALPAQTGGAGGYGAGGPGGAYGGPGAVDPSSMGLGQLLGSVMQQMQSMGLDQTPEGQLMMGLMQGLMDVMGLNGAGQPPLGSGLPGQPPLGSGLPGQPPLGAGTGGAYGGMPPVGGGLPAVGGGDGCGGGAQPGIQPQPGVLPPQGGVLPGGGYGGQPPVGGVQPPQGGVQPPIGQPGGGYGNPGGGGAQPGVVDDPALGPLNPAINYSQLNNEERTQISGLTDRERAALHLWGIQMTSDGRQDGGILENVLANPEQFQAAEVELARELVARDQAQYGGITGKSLDEEFFKVYEKVSGVDLSQRYANAPINFSDGPVDMNARLTGDNGLTSYENQVLQLWGHSPLLNQGEIDGNIIQYAMNSPNAMERNLVQSDLEGLLQADLMSDGVINGDSLENAMVDTMDRLYLGAPSASLDRTMQDAMDEAALRRQGVLPPPEAGRGEITGVPQGHPQASGGGGCPFLSGGGQTQVPPVQQQQQPNPNLTYV